MNGKKLMPWMVGFSLGAVLAVWTDRTYFRALPLRSEPSLAKPEENQNPVPVSPPRGVSFQWTSIESSNYSKFISNLRAIRCPEQTIRDIVIADLCQLYSTEWKRGLIGAKTNYWEAHFGCDPILSDSNHVAALGLQTNLQGVVQFLLDCDLRKELQKFTAISSMTIDREILLASFLPHEKILPVMAILNKYDALIQEQDTELFATADGLLKIKQLRDQQQHELAALLEPGELEQWNYRFSPVADEIRGRISDFDLSESEFRSLYAVQQQRNSDLYNQLSIISGTEPVPPDSIMGMMAHAEFNEDVMKEVLGSSRFKEYERSRNPQYQQLLYFARQHGIDSGQVNAIYEEHNRTEVQILKIIDNESFSPDQKEELIHNLRSSRDRNLAGMLNEAHSNQFFNDRPMGP